MQPGAGRLPDCVKAWQRCRGIEARCHTSHPVVGCRRHGDWLFKRIELVVAAPLKNCGEAALSLVAGNP